MVGPSGAVEFPVDHLARLDEQLGRPKWVVPVRPDDDLERLLKASIKLCKQGASIDVCVATAVWGSALCSGPIALTSVMLIHV